MDKDREKNLIHLYYDFMKKNSQFSETLLIVPKTPQSFYSFPTIVFKESGNTDYVGGKSLDRLETMDRCDYTVEIYTQDLILDNKKYTSPDVAEELKHLTFKFFNDIGFIRITGTKGEYIDISVDRYIAIFQGKFNNWNGQLI